MKISVLLACLALVTLAAAFGPPGRRGHRGDRGHHKHGQHHHHKGRGRCEQGKPDEDAWKCFKAKKACRVTENNVITKNITCANGTACAGAVTTLGNLKFQMCGPSACPEWPRWSFKCGPVFEPETEEDKGDRNTIRSRWLRRSKRSPEREDEDEDEEEDDEEDEEEGTFRPPSAHSQAEVSLCRLDTAEKQRWYRFACLVKQGSNELKKAECRHNGTCSASTQTTYTFKGVQYTARFCIGCERKCPWKGKGHNAGRGRGNQNSGRGRGQQNNGRGRGRQNTGRGSGRQNSGRGRNQEHVGRGRGQQNVGRGRDRRG